MGKRAIIYLFFLNALLFTTCKKYPDGGFTKRGPKNIIGEWKLTLYEVNGIDSTNLINYNGDEVYKTVTFLKNVSTVSVSHSGYNYSASFTKDNTLLEFSGSTNPKSCVLYMGINRCNRSLFVPEASSSSSSCTWIIKKLKKNEIILTSSQTNSYQIKLAK